MDRYVELEGVDTTFQVAFFHYHLMVGCFPAGERLSGLSVFVSTSELLISISEVLAYPLAAGTPREIQLRGGGYAQLSSLAFSIRHLLLRRLDSMCQVIESLLV